VQIYRLAGERARYVMEHIHWSRWKVERVWRTASVHDSPEALLAALYNEDGVMRRVEREAWSKACAVDQELGAIECEEVDQ